jgi:putative FmdB family regulatory protein
MPLYEYQCDACGHRFELIQKFSDPPVEECPNCGQRDVRKLLSSPAIQFKGSGWYITDYARKGGETKDAKESKASADGKESSASKESTESKTSSASKDTKDAKPAAGSAPAASSSKDA